MDRALYIAMSGAKEVMLSQATNSNNLANASTTGFKRDLEQFRAMHVEGPGMGSRAHVMAERVATDFTPGPMHSTGRNLDVAIQGEGFMTFETPEGDQFYGRTASIQLDANGTLTDGKGNFVIGAGNGPITLPPASAIEIGADGSVSVVPDGEPLSAIAVVDQLAFVNPPLNEMTKGEDGFLRRIDGVNAQPDNNVRVQSGALEGSNVNTVEAMVRMIELQRKFELQTKMMKTVNTADEVDNRLLRMQ